MKIAIVRHVDIINSIWITSETELVRSLNELGHETVLLGMGFGKRSNNASIKLINAPFGRAILFKLKMFFYLPYYSYVNKIETFIMDISSVYDSILLKMLSLFFPIKIFLDVRTIPVENNKKLEKQFQTLLQTC